ncbi:hypothetical protein AMTRI_Chr01g114080 [Amborella trichopoda]|uniref:Metaxin n=1 Tax=Amborella trichopoda TaxID=13333 RepID=W1PWG2_AMBTC|nr:mitochondrial outer membrane import complex protein METAXIN [Amborella trichopoda]ERN12503.1 hypothetical protein AMTR_s00025p00180550 [Amborella trichopoda]|eukprot:XP_006850922.1 mitochondrial outer membrane import complex protein METAXIN [Amborella trichopoda]
MEEGSEGLVLVARKPCFGLPTGCPICLPVHIYLKFANVPFTMHFDAASPDSEDIPSVELGDYVAFNSEKGGAIEGLKEDGIVDLDSKLPTHIVPDWLAMKAMITSWLSDAMLYELWVNSDGVVADKIYFSDLPWPIGKVLHWKQTKYMKQLLGIMEANAMEREAEIYLKAALAYDALSTKLGEQNFFFENRPTSLDAIFLGQTLFVIHASADTSILRSKLMEHENLVRYTESLKTQFLEASSSSSSSSVPRASFGSSSSWSSSTSRGKGGASRGGAKPKKKEKTEEEKTFKRRGKYFLAAQFIAVVVFLSLMGPSDDVDVEIEDDGLNYED